MKLIDAYTLAMTKRRAHRIRTAAVTLVSSLLFIVLFFVAITLQGLVDTSKGYDKAGWNEHFLTTTRVNTVGPSVFGEIFNSVKSQMTSELQARKIKVTDDILAGEEFNTELSTRAQAQIRALTAESNAKYEAKLGAFQANGIYHQRDVFGVNPVASLIEKDPDPLLKSALKAAQKQDAISLNRQGPVQEPSTISTIEDGLLREQLSPNQTMEWQPGQPYPMFAPYDLLLKLSDKTKNGRSSESVVALYQELIREYQGKVVSYCYRNEVAAAQLQQAVTYNQSLIVAKDTTTKPIPVDTCQPLDQAALKKANLLETENSTTRPDGTKRLFPLPAAVAPITQQMQFKVVGFLPYSSLPQSAPSLLDTLFMSVSMPPNGILPLVVPASVITKDELLQKIFNDPRKGAMETLIVDFPDRKSQKAYLATSCVDIECANSAKPTIAPFGSLTVATESLADAATTGGLYAAGVLGMIAGVIIMLSIGKVVADSSREIAVFRAIGAKRLDIIQIYTTYGLMLAMTALLMAFLIAIGVAILLSMRYAEELNLIFIRALGAYESDVTLWFVGFNGLWLGVIAGALLLASFIGVLIPTANAVIGRLNNKMREE